jgi:multiple sugar transport system permease protein
MVIFLAGLQDIPTELIESAKIDGANSWHIFRHITFPLMTPVLFFQVVMALIGSFRELTYPLLMGAVTYPPQIPRPITFFMVNTFTRIQNGFYGYGMALLWILFIAVVVVAGLLFLTERLWVYKGDAQESNA